MACRALGMYEYEVIDELLEKWLQENESQIRLSHYLDPIRPMIIQADRVNIVTQKVNVALVKEQLMQALTLIQKPDWLLKKGLGDPALREEVVHWRGELHRTLQKATRLPREDRDEELQELVAQAEKWF